MRFEQILVNKISQNFQWVIYNDSSSNLVHISRHVYCALLEVHLRKKSLLNAKNMGEYYIKTI